jgi:hypothetical protein
MTEPEPTSALHVEVAAPPEPGLLRPAIEAALTGRPFPGGPEAQVASAVAAYVEGRAAGSTEGSRR